MASNIKIAHSFYKTQQSEDFWQQSFLNIVMYSFIYNQDWNKAEENPYQNLL